jgi:acetyl-CoA acetyltransferase family protein
MLAPGNTARVRGTTFAAVHARVAMQPEGVGLELQSVVIVDAARSAFTRGGRGSFVGNRLDDLGAEVVRTLLARNPKVTPRMIEDVGLGQVGNAAELSGIGGDQVIRLAGLPSEVAVFETNRQCGSSMETLHRVAQAIMVGAIDCGMSLGMERMGRQLGGGGGRGRAEQNRVTKFNEKRLELTDEQRNMPPDHFEHFSVPIPDHILDAPNVTSMLQTAQNVAEMYGLTREELDQFAVESHRKYGEATEKGVYKDEIIPLEVDTPVFDDEGAWVPDEYGDKKVVEIDEGYRAGTNLETLGQLRTVPGYESYGEQELVITAGNACPTNDGISAVLLMSEKKALELGLEPLARITGMGVAGVKPQIMGLGPIPATKKALRHAGIEPGQIDRVEFNEAFAAQVIPSMADLGIDTAGLNVNGGSLAIGHPLGATGARLVGTVAREVQRSGTNYGLATQCIGVGMGISTIVEAM